MLEKDILKDFLPQNPSMLLCYKKKSVYITRLQLWLMGLELWARYVKIHSNKIFAVEQY